MGELARQYPRYGYRRIRIFLGRDGHGMIASRAYRLWQAARLQLPRRRPRKRIATGRPRPNAPTGANQVWSYDFVFNWCAHGQRLMRLTVTDEWTKEWFRSRAEAKVVIETWPSLAWALRPCSQDARQARPASGNPGSNAAAPHYSAAGVARRGTWGLRAPPRRSIVPRGAVNGADTTWRIACAGRCCDHGRLNAATDRPCTGTGRRASGASAQRRACHGAGEWQQAMHLSQRPRPSVRLDSNAGPRS
jgi:hypothetical protein